MNKLYNLISNYEIFTGQLGNKEIYENIKRKNDKYINDRKINKPKVYYK